MRFYVVVISVMIQQGMHGFAYILQLRMLIGKTPGGRRPRLAPFVGFFFPVVVEAHYGHFCFSFINV